MIHQGLAACESEFASKTALFIDSSVQIDEPNSQLEARKANLEVESLRRRCIAYKNLLLFIDYASRIEWPSRDEFEYRLLECWWKQQEELYGNYDRPHDETLCSESCQLCNQLISISNELNIYGCLAHGTVHRCTPTDRGCASVLSTPQGTFVCMYSGVEQSDRRFSQYETKESDFSTDVVGANFRYAKSRSEFREVPGYEYRGMLDASTTLGERIEASTLLSPIVAATERSLPQNRLPRLRYSYRLASRIDELERAADQQLHDIAVKVISNVVFTEKLRMLYNESERLEAEQLASTRLIEYHTRCKNQGRMPNIIDAACTRLTQLKSVQLIPIVPTDPQRIAKFALLCKRLWMLCHRSPYVCGAASVSDGGGDGEGKTSKRSTKRNTCTFEQFCLGALYMHKNGYFLMRRDENLYVRREHHFIFKDRFYELMLPREKHIDMFDATAAREIERNIAMKASVVRFGQRPAGAQRDKSTRFNRDGMRKQRKKSQKRRVTTNSSGAKMINMGRSVSVSERDALKSYYHTTLLVSNDLYEQSDITRGRLFIRNCLTHLNDADIEREATALHY